MHNNGHNDRLENGPNKLDRPAMSTTPNAATESVTDHSVTDQLGADSHMTGAHLTDKADITPKHVSTTAISESAALIKRPKHIRNGSRAFIWYLLSLALLVLDQWSKWLAETKLNFHEPVPVIEPVLNWTLAYNYGAAFSFLADQSGWQKWFFAGLALIMAIFLLIYLTKVPRQARLLSTGLALVLGGAVGNLIDRLLHGHVIDFIHVHYADAWHYPIFNVADMGICIGVALIVIDMLFLEGKRSGK